MKTNYFSTKSLSVFSLIGLVGLLVTSCGSYQNSSYYDRDGIYNSNRNNNNQVANSASSQEYRNYFESRIEPINDSTEVFTDVENYSSNYQNEADYNNGYTSWGGNPESITVNVYDNNWGWGWNNWGWNNWGYAGWDGTTGMVLVGDSDGEAGTVQVGDGTTGMDTLTPMDMEVGTIITTITITLTAVAEEVNPITTEEEII